VSEALRCLIVDDSPGFLLAVRRLLEHQGISVVGVASTTAEALEQAARLRPDITLVDIQLGAESGFDVARRLRQATPDAPSPVILISTHAEQDFADLIATSPALGFLSKPTVSAGSIRELMDGRGSGGPAVSGLRGT
jgi:DNA-binding NarL/FixJ family response regulator